MGISELLVQLANPQTMKSLSFANKMEGGLIVTCLGMGITFLSLIILQFIIDLLAKLIVKTEKKAVKVPAATVAKVETPDSRDGEELIAVISAAVAMKMQRSTGDIIIRNIKKVEEPSLLWNRAGVLEQMNTRL